MTLIWSSLIMSSKFIYDKVCKKSSVLKEFVFGVSMDMLYVDLSAIPSAGIHSHVELWGKQVSANLVAQGAGTIAYELFCNVKRTHFDYFDPANI